MKYLTRRKMCEELNIKEMEEIKTVKNMKKHSIYYKYLLL
jgi:hypothetical protein